MREVHLNSEREEKIKQEGKERKLKKVLCPKWSGGQYNGVTALSLSGVGYISETCTK